jgi:hypothetical protein
MKKKPVKVTKIPLPTQADEIISEKVFITSIRTRSDDLITVLFNNDAVPLEVNSEKVYKNGEGGLALHRGRVWDIEMFVPVDDGKFISVGFHASVIKKLHEAILAQESKLAYQYIED